MLQPFFDFIERWIYDFTWKRPIIVLVLILAIVGFFYLWESKTATFELQKLERATAMLSQLSKLEIEDKKQLILGERIVDSLLRLTDPKASEFRFTTELSERWVQALYGGALWFLLALVFVRDLVAGKEGTSASFFGCIIMSFLIGSAAYFVPIYWPKWIFPVVFNAILFTFLIWYGQRSKD